MKKIILSALAVLISAAAAYGEVTNEIKYSARLKSYQTPVNGNVNIKFTLYNDPDGINQLWTTGNVSVNVTSGIFTYMLKPVNVDWRKKDVYIEVQVNNKVLEPREKVSSYMYALHSLSAENLSSNTEINVEVGSKTAMLGLDDNNEIYSKSGGNEFYMVPKGAIVLWSGSVSKIPSGWALCDGNNGTPNLSGRFVLGYQNGFYDIGQSGGESAHKLTISEMPSHRHSSDRTYGGGGGGTGGGDLNNDGSGTYINTTYTGGDQPHNNMPPYYVLCYIMKK
jgi:hypothetical protein